MTVHRHRRSRIGLRGGLSLMELVLVLCIITTLAAIAAPRYASSTARYRADVAARRIVSDLSLARARAMASSANQNVVFDVANDEYRIVGAPDLEHPAAEYTARLSGPPYRAALISADLGGDAQVVFDGWGVPDSGGAIGIRVGNENRTVTLDPETGKAAVQ